MVAKRAKSIALITQNRILEVGAEMEKAPRKERRECCGGEASQGKVLGPAHEEGLDGAAGDWGHHGANTLFALLTVLSEQRDESQKSRRWRKCEKRE